MLVATLKSYQNTLGKGFGVTGTFMPGSILENITRLAYKEIGTLKQDDATITWRG
jgi:hypothetical protein